MLNLRIPLALIIVIFLCALTGCTQQSQDLKDLREDVKAIKEGQENIQKELQEIITLLKTRPVTGVPSEPEVVIHNTDRAPYKGDKNAKLTLIEFSDFQCPFCGRHVSETLPQLEAEYIKTGKIKYVFFDFPLDFHKNAFKAAEAASCAGEQGKFWQMHDKLYENQKALEPNDLTNYAKGLKLDMTKFQDCMDSDKYSNKVKSDLAEGQKAGVTGTPSFFLGVTNPKDSNVQIVKVIKGAQPYANFKQAIDDALSAKD